MRVMFLGTGAAEEWPAVFCQCANCRRARNAGGRNVRTKSSTLVNNDLKISARAEELVERLKPKNVEVAYDGLTIEL
ncbi:MAG: hypothetical protein HA496_05415 [Thaumarchaeota archaeon]|nr:hypothetical protein [Nitrososphaerota archaeon]